MNRLSRLLAHAAPPKPKHSFTEFTPMEYLMIDVASHFGLDKLDFQDRIQWSQDNRDSIHLMLYEVEAAQAEGRERLNTILDQAETPALFFAAASAWRKAEAGQAISYPISLDATASGIQLLGILAGCRKTAEICNVVPTGHRQDAYTYVYQRMGTKVNLQGQIDRSQVKKAMMTGFYGSTVQPKAVFGEGALLEIFYETVAEEAPGAWALNLELPGLWDPNVLAHKWELPDGFHCVIKVEAPVTDVIHVYDRPLEVKHYVNKPIPQSRSLCPNLTHSVDGMVVREMHRRCSYLTEDYERSMTALKKYLRGHVTGKGTKTKDDKVVIELCRLEFNSGFLSARILSHVNQDNIGHLSHQQMFKLKNLLNSLPKKPFPLMSIHD